MINATIRVRGLSDEAFSGIMELLEEEAKDVNVEQWRTGEEASYIPRQSASRRNPRAPIHRSKK